VGRAARAPDQARRTGKASPEPCYGPDLAWVHHVGYAHHVNKVHAGIVELLRTAGLSNGSRVLDAGCGSGLLARELVAAGFEVHGIDASPAMIDLARECAPTATFDVRALPLRAVVEFAADAARGPSAAPESGLPQADAIVSTGHVLNYLDSREAIAQALAELAQALRPGGAIAFDLMTEAYCAVRNIREVHAKVDHDWVIVTRFSRPAPFRFDRDLTVFRCVDGQWRRSDEHHRNVTFDADDAVRILRDCGIEAEIRRSFGIEELPTGMAVVTGLRKQGSG
jgi:SAM-dependent methyltransferase